MTLWTPDLAKRKGPRYRAIADALAEDFRAGRLKEGTRLPTHRDLAGALRVTVGTVSRAYSDAERRGVIKGGGGGGGVVPARPPRAPPLRGWGRAGAAPPHPPPPFSPSAGPGPAF